MRSNLLIVLLFSSFILQSLQAQQVKIKPGSSIPGLETNAGVKSSTITTTLLKSVDHQITGDKWAVSVRSRSSRKHYAPGVAEIKEAKLQGKIASYNPAAGNETNSRAVTPLIGTNFEANWSTESTPPDNTIAIANNGNIITANNDGIEYYNGSGTFLYFDFWSDFFDDPQLSASLFDPKVIYDSGADRFVLIVLHGSNPSTSKVVVCFSKTNNPLNGWWIYTLTGNPLQNDCWFDYPGLGVSNNEIYVTGNLFRSSFNQSVIYQIPKAAGYAGNSLDWQYWSGLNTDPYDAFTLIPASFGHQGNYGPGIYMVSSESAGENRIRLWDLTDDMSGTPQLLTYTIAVDPYSPAANALQSGSNDQLDNGDCRIQNAFYLNGIVHFVFHSDIGDGWNGIHYNRLDVVDQFNQTSTFGLQGSYDYSYPAVVPFSTSNNDLSVMVAFLRSSGDTYPEVRVVNCDQQMNWSPSVRVKAGETFVDFLNDDERWGDYTGIARKHNSPDPRIWLAGSYGANINNQNVFNTYKTWVAEVRAGAIVSVDPSSPTEDVQVFPNPTYDLMQIQFSMAEREHINIELFDANGRLVKLLYSDSPKAGDNRLTFNKGALSQGSYILSIRSNTHILHNEKLVILD